MSGALRTARLPFAAVLFDCDGVLVDSETITIRVLAEMLRELGWEISFEETVRAFIGRALVDEWEVILANTGFRITDAWVHEFHVRRDDALRVDVAPMPGAERMMAEVVERFGDRIALASGADRVKITMQLDVTGLGRWFGDRVFSGMELAASKPAPDVYLAAAAALGVDPADALVVEDTVAGVTAGIAAGATVFGFSTGSAVSTRPEALRGAGASLVFSSLEELPGLIDAYAMRERSNASRLMP
ncbi:HAD family hydrolase [Leucobacter chromiiresistens]|uniref:Haloacid dehalogenase superfamily, subfamily IA, variant 3 with third motif having DD or ED n=1 Tax=Leucobacter chromiiresistens TaxID=1079994 RepID=A0A1H0YYZ1_9MICO|nr:HAD family phosphatase [Leucobacter chromiiresistens]SDQ20412.1 haloacid dehalogenase superfamily, subfamily IA, variant 3 with third motif having DD or ED [Leucobacter chromiiresistens]